MSVWHTLVNELQPGDLFCSFDEARILTCLYTLEHRSHPNSRRRRQIGVLLENGAIEVYWLYESDIVRVYNRTGHQLKLGDMIK